MSNYGLDLSSTERMLGILCPHCNKRGGMRKNQYTRGYNSFCQQASGDDGFYCMECTGITWRKSFEECRRITPAWCTVTPDSQRSKFFPGFKHNIDSSRYHTHSSNLQKENP
jgi:hypothetical protein